LIKEKGNKVIEEGYADLVAYGKPYISNPDLVERFEHNLALAADQDTFYSESKGYTDYPNASK
jgi:N-ethylmaleimide reductase